MVGVGGGSAGGGGSAWDSKCGLEGGASKYVSSEEVFGGEQSAKEMEGTQGGSAGVVSPEMLEWTELNPCWTGCCI